ncbi:MAG: hypothetical protein J6Q15_00620, partial [Clostridia bacterium]|nr:hypothetical protein [Clostridia bacterium]
MSKKRILLGMFMLMAMAFCGIWFNKVPSVFASQATSYATIENEAGTFTGQGYYVVGQTATLIARMNPGYQFDGWISVDIEGNKIKDLSPDIEYTFVVDDNIRIKATWSQIVYNVDFDQTLMVDGELKDFNYTINNNDDVDGNYYYGDELQLTFTTKVYIDDLSDDDIFINGNSISSLNLINSEIITQYNTDTDGLLNSFVVTFNITEDVIFNIDYNYLYRLQLLSGNTIDINKLVQFVTLTNYRAKLDDYTYLAYDNKEITLAISAGDSVYTLLGYQFEGMDVSNIYSQSYVLDKNSTFTIYYSKKNYEVGFSYHIINQYGEYDLLDEEIYNLAPISLTAGEQIEFDYNIDTKKITITDVVDSMTYEYNYPSNLYGYKFVGFAISNELLDTNAYILSDSEPSNVEIQLIFEYIEYLFEIKLVDEYFADGVEFGYTYNDGLTNLVTGMEINIYANTNKYQIKGWSWTSNPTNSDYITGITDQSNYTFTFTPNSDEMVNNTLYLDLDNKYTSITYILNQDSIEENLNHDIVKVDLSNNKLIFSNSENVLDVQEITYLDSDITQIGDVTTITTSAFGDIIISNNSLTYSVNDLPQQSISKNTVDGVDEYVFEKYTYFGNLKVSVIEYIQLFDVNNEIIVKIYGTSYDENGANTTEIQSLTTTKTYIDAMDAYQINDFPYNVYLYMNEEDYDYIELRGVKYYYNGTNFELNHALINVPEVVQYSVIKNSQYTITLSNLLPNMLLVYSTESTDALNYSFTSFTDGKSGLVNYNYNNSVRCILATNSITSVNVEYRKLSNDITLNINNESAYQYADIQFTVAGVAGTGKTIKASNGESIIIIISSDKISKGYKFDGFMFNGDNVTNINSPNTLELTMRDIYVNQIINICFSEIEYMININYVDIDKNVLTDNIHGGLILAGQVEYVTKLSVALSGEYILNIIADNGYYVSNAYIGADEYVITDLISSNQSNLLVTSWKINNSNFVEAIINNADENNELNLYIYFAIHTYSVKVYFEIDENASLITYPDLYINNVRAQLNQRPEMIGGVTTTRYYVQDSGFEYNSKVELRANNFMLGTRFEKWTYNGYQLPQKTSSHEIDPITQDIVLTMKLQYIAYGVQFIAVDTEDNSCDYGSIVTAVTTIKLFGRIDYRVNLTQGYIWKETYYINDEGVRTNEGAEPNFIFNPANFSIENSGIKLYVVFGVKEVNINVVNEQKGSLPIIGDWATYTLSRVRGENSEMLEDSDYKFQTGDLLIMELTPVSMGIDLGMVKLSSITITSATASPYSLVAMNKVEDEKVVGIYYRLTILFSPSVMGSLPDGGVELRNILNVKTFNIVYTYNHIDYKFGVELSIKYRGGTFKAGSDEIITEPGISFGTAFTFGSSYAGMNNEITNKFKIVGYIIAGIEQQASGSFTLQDAYLWEQVALAKHMDGNNNILVVLVINPKITLNNYTDYNITSGYVYERTYIGENQGLATSGADIDV